MKLVGVANVLPDLFYCQGALKEKALGFVDPDAGKEFKRGLPDVAAEKLGQIGRGKAHRIRQGPYIDVLHIVLLHIGDCVVHMLLGVAPQ